MPKRTHNPGPPSVHTHRWTTYTLLFVKKNIRSESRSPWSPWLDLNVFYISGLVSRWFSSQTFPLTKSRRRTTALDVLGCTITHRPHKLFNLLPVSPSLTSKHIPQQSRKVYKPDGGIPILKLFLLCKAKNREYKVSISNLIWAHVYHDSFPRTSNIND